MLFPVLGKIKLKYSKAASNTPTCSWRSSFKDGLYLKGCNKHGRGQKRFDFTGWPGGRGYQGPWRYIPCTVIHTLKTEKLFRFVC
jgi:hypothetical protein